MGLRGSRTAGSLPVLWSRGFNRGDPWGCGSPRRRAVRPALSRSFIRLFSRGRQTASGSPCFRSLGPGNGANGPRNHAEFETPIRSEFPSDPASRRGRLVYRLPLLPVAAGWPATPQNPGALAIRPPGGCALGSRPFQRVEVRTPCVSGSVRQTPLSLSRSLVGGVGRVNRHARELGTWLQSLLPTSNAVVVLRGACQLFENVPPGVESKQPDRVGQSATPQA
jgi:hypothetical protein